MSLSDYGVGLLNTFLWVRRWLFDSGRDSEPLKTKTKSNLIPKTKILNNLTLETETKLKQRFSDIN